MTHSNGIISRIILVVIALIVLAFVGFDLRELINFDHLYKELAELSSKINHIFFGITLPFIVKIAVVVWEFLSGIAQKVLEKI